MNRILRLMLEGLGVFVACAAIPFAASLIWIIVHTRPDGVDQGNAPGCYLVLGAAAGLLFAPLYCWARYKRLR